MKKWKNLLKISSFDTRVPKQAIIWCPVPEIRGERDIIFCVFRLVVALLPPHPLPQPLIILKIEICKTEKTFYRYYAITHMYFKGRSYDVSVPKNKARQTEFVVILATFCPFTPLTTWKIKISTTEKNTWKHYHFTRVHHKSQLYHK